MQGHSDVVDYLLPKVSKAHRAYFETARKMAIRRGHSSVAKIIEPYTR